MSDQFDPMGEITARTYAAESGLIFVTAYADNHPDIEVQVISVADFVKHLVELDVVDRLVPRRLSKRVLPFITGLPPDWQALQSSREVLIDEEALRVLCEVGALSAIGTWINTVFVPETSLSRLQGRVDYASWSQDCRGRFASLRAALESGRTGVEWVSLKPDERQVKLDGERAMDSEFEIAWRYCSDLFNVALKTRCPLWTDDRATRAAALTKEPVHRFGTDSLLAYGRVTGKLDDQHWETLVQKMTQAGYLTLTIDPDYLVGLISK